MSQISRRGKVKGRTHAETARFREMFVSEVQNHKELLFGQFSSSVTDAVKMAKWEDIRLKMVQAGESLLETKNADYVKKTYWQTVRTQSMKNIDACRLQTGAEANNENLSQVSIDLFYLTYY
jgi:ribonuclease I